MKSLKLAYQKLSDYSSNVSVHYLISRDGIIYNLLCPKYKAWHAGISKWMNDVNINDYSIGIELENKGHDFGYSNFTRSQYSSLKKIINFLVKNYFIKESNIIFHSDISPNRKKDPGEKFIINKVDIKRFNKINKSKKTHNLNNLLRIYGFHNSYIKNHKDHCIIAVKRTLNYKKINKAVSKNFINNFYNLLFR